MAEDREPGGLSWLDPLRKQGVAQVEVEDLPDTLTLEDLARRCEREERLLRRQYRMEGHEYADLKKGTRLAEFPPDWDLGLANPGRQPTTMRGCLSRWAYLSHLWRVRSQNLHPRSSDLDADQRRVLRDMLERKPIIVELGHRTVSLTGRSYAALETIAAHSLRLKDLHEKVKRLEAAESRIMRRLALLPRGRSRKLSRVLRRLLVWHEQAIIEAGMHRQAIYANLMTEHGGPAESITEAPEWWNEITPEDDGLLLKAAFMVGHERLAEVSRGGGESDDDDSWAWGKLFSTIERVMKAEMASLWNKDLFRLQAWVILAESTADELEP